MLAILNSKMKKPKKLTKKRIKKLERRAERKQFKEWAEVAKATWCGECAVCKSKKFVNVHHIIPRTVKELRFDQDNAVVLCPLHHKWSNEISPHKNPFVFFIWFRDNHWNQFQILEQKARALDETRI